MLAKSPPSSRRGAFWYRDWLVLVYRLADQTGPSASGPRWCVRWKRVGIDALNVFSAPFCCQTD